MGKYLILTKLIRKFTE